MISLICAMVSVMPPIEATASLVDACMAATCDGDFLGRLRGLVGERLHLGGHDRKAAAGFAGARRLDGGVEREQIGLRGDRVDQLDHLADLLGAGRERADGGVGALGVADRLAGDLAGARHLAGNLGDRTGQLFGGGRDRADIVRTSSRDAAPTVAARALASLAVAVIDCAVVCMPAAAVETERTMPVTLRSKSLAIFSIAARRSAAARACVSASACSSPRIRTALSLKIWTVAAIAPTSSPRPMPGISPSSLPSASACMRAPS